MNRILGYLIMGTGLFIFFYFYNYHGTAIPLKELWLVLSLFPIVIGGYFLAKFKFQQQNNQRIDTNRITEIEKLKKTGEKIKLPLANVEVKTRTYQKEIANNNWPSEIQMLDSIYDDNRNYKTKEIRQTYIVFYKEYGGKTFKFVSSATSQNVDAVKDYIDRQGGITLYIDPNNPTVYYFDFPFL